MILVAVADIKQNILGTPLFEQYIQNENMQEITMIFKDSFNDQPRIGSFATLIEKNFPVFTFFDLNISKMANSFKHFTVQIL